jgi:hypothetical protein
MRLPPAIAAAATELASALADAPAVGKGPVSTMGLPDTQAALAGLAVDDPAYRLVDGLALDDAPAALLMLLAASQLDARAARAVEALAGPGGVPRWLAQQLLPALEPHDLGAFGPLRRLALVEVAGEGITARLTLPAAVLDWLQGLPCRDALVTATMQPLPVAPALAEAPLVTALGEGLKARMGGVSPVLVAEGHEIAALAAGLAALGLSPFLLRGGDLPATPEARAALAATWSRDAALDPAALIIDPEGPSARLLDFAGRITGHVLLAGTPGRTDGTRPLRLLPATGADRRARWALALGPTRSARLGRELDRVARQFRLNGAMIDAIAAAEAATIDAADDAAAAAAHLWHVAARAEPARGLAGVTLIEPAQNWNDLVLPPGVEAMLHRLEHHVRHAGQVFDGWGFAPPGGTRGRGVAALFAGPSGTGKTLAAEVLAQALDLRMMVIDLSQLISKYVGETSKNIAAAFDLAERSGAVMVWNEGDAIWGARGSVGHAVDRHINAEVGDLLQRIEAFEGFTIITTNLKQNIDPAFLRRFRFVVDFPFPSDAERLRLWQRVFPPDAPVDEMDWRVLAGQPLSGAGIRAIALGSAFVAAARGGRIDRALVAAELAEELRKSNQLAPVIDWGTPQ